MDIVGVLEARFGRVTQSSGSNGVEYIVDCPMCGRHKLSINPAKGVYQCWRGCMSGRLDRLLGMRLPSAPVRREIKKDKAYEPPGPLTPLHELPAEHQACTYIRQRGFDPVELSRVYGVCWCSSGRKYSHGIFNSTNTVVVPFKRGGALVGWQSRLLYDPEKVPEDSMPLLGFAKDDDGSYIRPPKYMTMPGFDKRAYLFNMDAAREGNTVVVTEGVFDAMAVGKCAVATLGKGVSDEQIDMLRTLWDLVVLLLDPDAKADQDRLVHRIGPTVATVPVTLVGYKDAGEAPKLEIWRQIDNAVRSSKRAAEMGIRLEDMAFKI